MEQIIVNAADITHLKYRFKSFALLRTNALSRTSPEGKTISYKMWFRGVPLYWVCLDYESDSSILFNSFGNAKCQEYQFVLITFM